MFELTDQPATLAHLNVRTEKIGDDERPAADLKIEFDASNDMLIHFGPQLRSSLFAKAAAGMNAFDRIVQSLTQPAPPRARKLTGAVAKRSARSRVAIKQAVRLLRRHGWRVEPPEGP